METFPHLLIAHLQLQLFASTIIYFSYIYVVEHPSHPTLMISRYAAAHRNGNGPGDARPTALQIVKDEGVEGKLKAKVIVITGVSSGIGIETVRALSATGATLFLTARNVTKAKAALAEILNSSRMEIIEMDQESFDSVRAAAKAILTQTDKINILINNAGIMAVQEL